MVHDYNDFVDWKRKLNYITLCEYLEKQAMSIREFKKWKYQNDLSNYDEIVLIKLYELETKCKRLENIILENLAEGNKKEKSK